MHLVHLGSLQSSRAGREEIAMKCSWCTNPNAEVVDDTLCRSHQAEAEGITEGQLDKRDSIEYAEYMDTRS